MKKMVLIILVLLILAACQPGTNAQQAQLAIKCETLYRTSTVSSDEPLSTSSVFELRHDQKKFSETYTDMEIMAQYYQDDYEGRSMRVSISDPVSGRQLASFLYQFPLDEQPVNQFVGGHGFTGLVYIYHPESPAELQFFCELQ